jgi:hypothetical protein
MDAAEITLSMLVLAQAGQQRVSESSDLIKNSEILPQSLQRYS